MTQLRVYGIRCRTNIALRFNWTCGIFVESIEKVEKEGFSMVLRVIFTQT